MLHSCCSYLLLLSIEAIVRLCLTSTVEGYDARNLNSGSNDDLILLPLNPEVEAGQWLTLNCTILPHYTGDYTNRDLYFRHGNANFTNITLVGSRTALLKLQWNMTDDSIGGGHIRCALPDRPFQLSAVQHVTVVRRPLQPSVTGCYISNWAHANCTWQPSISQQQEHMHILSPLIQTLQWKLGAEVSSLWQNAICKGDLVDSCLWDISLVVDDVDRFVKSESCCVRIFARVHLTYLHFEEQSASFCFRPALNVILDKPRNVSAVNTGARQISVHWQGPLLDLNQDVVYAVVVLSQWTDVPVIHQTVVNHSLSFTSIPHTKYTVTVKVKTFESQFWSSPTSRSFTTPPAVPKMSPASSTNAFAVSHMGRYTRTVIVYWKTLPVQEYYGRQLNYIVLTRKPPAFRWNELSIVKSADTPCSEVHVNTADDVELTVIARNEVGDTSPEVVMHLPAVQSSEVTTSLFTELVVELTNDSTVIWSWRLNSPQRTGNLTLFWCRSRSPLGHCIDDIQWMDVAASQSQYNLSIDANDTNHYYYGAALKADSDPTHSRGIEWVKCLYNFSGLAAPVQDVHAFVPSYGHAGQLLVTWVHPPCDNDYRHGYIKSFVLYYCRHAGTECVDDPKCGCVDDESRVVLPGYLTGYNLTRLEPDKKYAIWMYSWTRAGQSLTHSDEVFPVTSAPVLTPAVIAALAVSFVVVLLLTVVVIWMLCKYCRRCHAKLWSPMAITVPQANVQSNASTALSAPIVEYSRISYTRQGSRLSSSSRDSGQFGIAGGSPLLSPESCSESVSISFVTPDNHVELRNQPRPVPMNYYVNDSAVVLRRPAENSHHQPSSSSTGHVESFPLQPLKPRQLHETEAGRVPSTDAADDADDDETHVTDSLMNHRQNGGCDTVTNSDYIPHEWLKM